jgi:hypothetical protein
LERGSLSEEASLEDGTRVDEVEAGLELGFEAPGAELAFGTAVDTEFDLTAVDAALVDVEHLGGLPA